jgi:hypothetical protein
MDLADTRAVIDNARSMLEQSRPVVDSISELPWRLETGYWPILLRCILRRQYDAMETIIGLARGQSHSATPLLRPACEEYLWLKFLRTIPATPREAIIVAKSQIEVAQTAEAQESELTKGTMRTLGFGPHFVNDVRQRSAQSKAEMTVIGKQLNWTLRKNQYFPSVAEIARTIGEQRMYSVIYHATSRTVHFNVAELLRRAWGTSDKVIISSKAMNEYWLRFALYWGWGLFALTLNEVCEEFGQNDWPIADFPDPVAMEKLIVEWGEAGKVPIITPEEMNQHVQPGEHPFS